MRTLVLVDENEFDYLNAPSSNPCCYNENLKHLLDDPLAKYFKPKFRETCLSILCDNTGKQTKFIVWAYRTEIYWHYKEPLMKMVDINKEL